jgi:hypothetical protein
VIRVERAACLVTPEARTLVGEGREAVEPGCGNRGRDRGLRIERRSLALVLRLRLACTVAGRFTPPSWRSSAGPILTMDRRPSAVLSRHLRRSLDTVSAAVMCSVPTYRNTGRPGRCLRPRAAGGPRRPRSGSGGRSAAARSRARPPARDSGSGLPRRGGRPYGSSDRAWTRRPRRSRALLAWRQDTKADRGTERSSGALVLVQASPASGRLAPAVCPRPPLAISDRSPCTWRGAGRRRQRSPGSRSSTPRPRG